LSSVHSSAEATGGSTAISTGIGDIDVNYYVHGFIRSKLIPESAIINSDTGFVHPDGMETAQDCLRNSNIAILVAPRASGRGSAALWLLRWAQKELVEAAGTGSKLKAFRRLLPDWDEPNVEQLPAWRSHGYVLDLSDSDEGGPDSWFARDLLTRHSSQLKGAGSYLVLTVTPEMLEAFRSGAVELIAELERPAARSVVKAHLEDRHCRSELTEWLKGEEFKSILASAMTPGEAARLAKAMVHAANQSERSANNEADISGRPSEKVTDGGRSAALDEFRGWSKYLRDWFRENEDVYNRALIIATAVLDKHAFPQQVIEAANSLLGYVGESTDPEKPLRAPDLVERFSRIQAELTEEFVSLTALREGLDEALIDHVWRQRPALHRNLVDWLADLATALGAPATRFKRITQMMVSLAKAQKSIDWKLIRDWATTGGKHRDLAAEILNGTVLDPVLGTRVRRKLLDWSDISDGPLLELVAEICGGEFGRERTGRALKRLDNILAKNATPASVRAAQHALRTLASNDELRPKVVDAVHGLLKTDRSPVSTAAFLALVERPADDDVVVKLLRDCNNNQDVFQTLTLGWQALRDLSSQKIVTATLNAWFDAVDNEVLPREIVMKVCLPLLRSDLDRTVTAEVLITSDRASVRQEILRSLLPRHSGPRRWPGPVVS